MVKFFLLALLLSCASHQGPKIELKDSSGKSAASIIREFYHTYLNKAQYNSTSSECLKHSKAFDQLLDENYKVCTENAGTDICGWGSGGDVYLNAQEIAPDLNVQNSGLQVFSDKGLIIVTLNVYPSYVEDKDFYDRTIMYSVILEDGKWVVDDVFYDKSDSARESILKEIEIYKKK